MPIYEYICSECGHTLEALQKVSDPPLTLCPACQGNFLSKQISKAGFRLKGSGWYETDFKGEGDKKRNLVEKEGESQVKSEKAEQTTQKEQTVNQKTEAKAESTADKKTEAASSASAPKKEPETKSG